MKLGNRCNSLPLLAIFLLLPHATRFVMDRQKVNIAVVEDNGMARINLRNHLMQMGFNKIACYSHGRELVKGMQQKHFDLILMDYHLGNNKNGVEVIHDINKTGLLKNVTCLIFVTSDRLPIIIGQIVDVHPDDLVVKPYTIRILEKTLLNCLKINMHCRPVLHLIDQQKWQKALEELDQIIKSNILPKSKTSLLKLRARLLLKLGRFEQATELYESVLAGSDKVIWAKWGVIHAQFLAGKGEVSEEILKDMLGAHLTNDKACEWLARISVGRKEYVKAEEYIDLISEGSLSTAATKLKTYLYQIQDKVEDAIDMLERKRMSNKHIREKYAELSLELARCYLYFAETKGKNERAKPIKVARFLIGSAGRHFLEEGLQLKKEYMNVLAYILEDNIEKANELLRESNINDLKNADITTMTDAVKAWVDVGDEMKAAQILFNCGEKIKQMEDLTDQSISDLLVSQREDDMGERRPRALKYNKQGLGLHSNRKYVEAVEYFYQAYILFPKESAFGLNLLQSLVEAELAEFSNIKTLRVFNELDKRDLNASNRKRLNEIGKKISLDKDRFIVTNEAQDNSHSINETDEFL